MKTVSLVTITDIAHAFFVSGNELIGLTAHSHQYDTDTADALCNGSVKRHDFLKLKIILKQRIKL